MEAAEEYTKLNEKIHDLGRQHAVLVSQEEAKAKERSELAATLKAAGINPDQPEAEIARLEKEVNDLLEAKRREITQFEVLLKAGPTQTSTVEVEATQPDPTPEVANLLPVEDIDI